MRYSCHRNIFLYQFYFCPKEYSSMEWCFVISIIRIRSSKICRFFGPGRCWKTGIFLFFFSLEEKWKKMKMRKSRYNLSVDWKCFCYTQKEVYLVMRKNMLLLYATRKTLWAHSFPSSIEIYENGIESGKAHEIGLLFFTRFSFSLHIFPIMYPSRMKKKRLFFRLSVVSWVGVSSLQFFFLLVILFTKEPSSRIKKWRLVMEEKKTEK